MGSKATIYLSFSKSDIEDNWIQGFLPSLKFSAGKILKNSFDLLIQGKDFVTIDSTFKVNISDYFIVVLTAKSNNNEEYQKELSELCKLLKLNNNDDSESLRIFKVLLSPNNEIKQPESLKSLIGYNLFDYSGRRKSSQLYDFKFPDVNIWSRMLDLVYDIKDTINTFSNAHENLPEHFVFLGNCSNDQHQNRDEIRRELQHFGIRSLPIKDLPNEQEKIKSSVTHSLMRCKLIIQLIGEQYGGMSVDGKYSIYDLENQVIRQFIKDNPGKNRLIWIPADLKVNDSKQELFITRIKREDSDSQSEIIEASLDEFKNILIKFIEEGVQKRDQVKYSNSICLIAKPETDISFIEDAATKSNVSLNIENRINPNAIYLDYINILEQSNNILIYYNEPDSTWLKSKLGDIVKIIGKGRTVPYNSVAVLSYEKINTGEIAPFVQNIENILVRDNSGLINFFRKSLE